MNLVNLVNLVKLAKPAKLVKLVKNVEECWNRLVEMLSIRHQLSVTCYPRPPDRGLKLAHFIFIKLTCISLEFAFAFIT